MRVVKMNPPKGFYFVLVLDVTLCLPTEMFSRTKICKLYLATIIWKNMYKHLNIHT